jgi:hypothetical protein
MMEALGGAAEHRAVLPNTALRSPRSIQGKHQGTTMTNALAVMAHHDDHVLFMGATMQRTKRMQGWDWTVTAMCLNPAYRTYFCRI